MATLLKTNWKYNLCLLLLCFSCTSDPMIDYGLGEYYVEIVTALKDDAFRLDTGEIIFNTDPGPHTSFEPGSRIYLHFSYTDIPAGQIKVHGACKIALGDLKSLPNPEIQQQINDPVRLESIWIGSHYLNLQFYMEYKSESHKISLLTPESQVNQPEVDLFFRHDKNGDRPGYPVIIYVSYDLSNVLGEPQGNRTVRVHLGASNYGNKIYVFKY